MYAAFFMLITKHIKHLDIDRGGLCPLVSAFVIFKTAEQFPVKCNARKVHQKLWATLPFQPLLYM